MNEHHNADVSKMICGPEVDKLLAEAIGWVQIEVNATGNLVGRRKSGDFTTRHKRRIPAYSTSDYDALDWIKALMNSGSKTRELAAEILEGFSDYSNPGDGLLALELVKAVVETVCQYPGNPVRAGVCDGTRTTCGSCRDGFYRIKPALAAILKGNGCV